MPAFPPSRHRIETVADNRFLAFSVATRPIPKGRPRLSRFRVYTPQRTLDYESVISQAAADAMAEAGLDAFCGPVRLQLTFVFAGKSGTVPTAQRDGDVDNLSKSVLDAMNGVVFLDDRQVVAMRAEKRCSEADAVHVVVQPYVELTVSLAGLLAIDDY